MSQMAVYGPRRTTYGIYQPGRSDKLFIRWRFFCSQHLSDWSSRICITHFNHWLILISQSVQHKRGRDSRWYSIKQSPTTIISDTESYSAIFGKRSWYSMVIGTQSFILLLVTIMCMSYHLIYIIVTVNKKMDMRIW